MAYGRWYKQEKIRSLVPKTVFHKLSIHISRHQPYAISHQLFSSSVRVAAETILSSGMSFR